MASISRTSTLRCKFLWKRSLPIFCGAEGLRPLRLVLPKSNGGERDTANYDNDAKLFPWAELFVQLSWADQNSGTPCCVESSGKQPHEGHSCIPFGRKTGVTLNVLWHGTQEDISLRALMPNSPLLSSVLSAFAVTWGPVRPQA